MKALVNHGPGERGWDSVEDPTILEPTDIIVRIDTSTICGTDLHILKGDVPETTPGTILGHEAVGTVQEVGAGVGTVKPGDRVLMSCVTSCGRCRFCNEGRYGQCLGGGGWIFGHLINGLQAEYARVPFADNSVYKVPGELTDEQVLFLADILPTAYEVGVVNGMVSPGDTVAIVGAGPIGLAAILTARLYTPGRVVAIDLADSRLEGARRFGADVTINNRRDDAVAHIMELTDGRGADFAFEAVGVPPTFGLAFVLLLLTFRSIVIPFTAIVMNVLSVGAAYGLLVLIFQQGHLHSLLGFTSIGGVVNWLPLFLFVILFGLSMDYHVFILSRVREAHDHGMSTEDAVAHGIKATAGVVTSAAIVMVAVFAIFAMLGEIVFQMMGVDLAAAILIDATILRAVLLPSTMKLLGDWNWYLPRWLGWLPSITTRRTSEPALSMTAGRVPRAILPRRRSHRSTFRSPHGR